MIPFSLHAQIEADSVFLRDLPLSQLRLQNQSTVPWCILVPRCEHTEIYELAAKDRQQLMEEIACVSSVLMQLFKPDKINVGSLGNFVPQLHIHVVGRFKTDPAWPQPVWGKLLPSPYAIEALDAMRRRLIDDTLWT